MGKKNKPTHAWLRKIGVPAVLIPGLIAASVWGAGWYKSQTNYYSNKQIFPEAGVVSKVVDGDTFEMKNGIRVRLVGVNAPPLTDNDKARQELGKLVVNKQVFLEYDRYQDDKFGRILAWVWINCETKPKFLPADYMFLNKRQSKPGLTDNPDGCKKGKMVQEELVKRGVVKTEVYEDRGELKYQARLMKI